MSCSLSCCHRLDGVQVGTAEGAEDGTLGDPQIECPLCHTKFSLEDGKVTEYCPKDGPIAWAVGTLKSKESPVDAKVCRVIICILICTCSTFECGHSTFHTLPHRMNISLECNSCCNF